MQSIALSTVLILLLLLPGFFFVLGLYAPERFARDAAPQNPVAAFAATVCFSFLSHALLTFAIHVLGKSVPWQTIITGLYAAPPTAVGAGSNLGSLLEEHPFAVCGYVVSSWAAGFILGIITGTSLLRLGLQRLVIRHPWAHSFKAGTTGTITFAHVLSEVAHEGRVLLYRGLLRYFGLRADGTFAYIVLSATEQRFLHVDGPTPKTGKLRVIGASVSADPVLLRDKSTRSADQEFLRFALVVSTGLSVVIMPFVSSVAVAGLVATHFGLWWIALRPVVEEQMTGAVMVISGERIMDVVFQGHAVAGLERTTRRAPEALKTLEATEETAEEVEQHREQLVDLWGGELPTRDLQQLSLKEMQQMLFDIGYDPGPIDGVPGPRTRAAVREFQDDSGLAVDGILGSATRMYLLLEHEALKTDR
jgi:hypothetical protein